MRCLLCPFAIVLLGLLATPGWAQKPPPGSAAPTLTPSLPAGVQRGQLTELVLTGTNLAGPTGVTLGTPAEVMIPTAGKNGQDNTKLKVQIRLPGNAPLGLYELRLGTKRGLSNPLIVAVDDLPQHVENGKNNAKETAHALPVPCVVGGRTDAEKADYYKFKVAAGQRLSFDVLGRRLGGLIDPRLALYDGKSMRELAFDDDSPGCQGDPRLSYTFKAAGEYLVEVKDVLNRGGADYVYRLRIGDFPLAMAPLPMAARRGSKAKVAFAGPQVEGVAAVDVAVPADPTASVVWVSPKGPSGLSGWPVALALSDHDELLETEPNNEPAKANRVPVPCGVTGRFQHSDDLDCYRFTAKKGQKLLIEAHTLELYTSTLVYMVLKNAKTNAEVAKSKPQAPAPGDQRFEFTPPDNGDYVLEVQHLLFTGGPSEVYRVTITPTAPSFDLVLPGERFELSPGSFAPIPVQVIRRGYTGPIELSVSGAAGMTGTATVKAGQTAAAVVVHAKADQPLGPAVARVVGKAMVNGKPVVQPASARAVLSQLMNGLVYPPLGLTTQVGLGVKDKPPFTLTAKLSVPRGVPGIPLTVTLTATRAKGFAGDIAINPPLNLPPTVAAPKIPAIAKGKNDVSFPLALTGKVPMGDYALLFSAKTKLKEGEVGTAALPIDLVVGLPFTLKTEPATLTLKPGAKVKLKVTAVRHGGYKGPITVEVRKLPPNVTSAKATIAADKTTAELDIVSTAKAAPAEKKDVDVLGTATALNNMQSASPAFTVQVQSQKK